MPTLQRNGHERQTVTLTWTRHDHITGTYCAVGLRGTYTIEASTLLHWLKGTGHDGLPMHTLPTAGQPFAALQLAQAHAERVDNAAAEANIGGE
jgi:hypothetical protein